MTPADIKPFLTRRTNVVAPEQMPFYYFDTNSPSHPARFYRSVWLH